MTPRASGLAPHGFFVTGTDTGVGKTRAACVLLRALARSGLRAVGMKPVAAGALRDAEGLLNDDVAALTAASTFAAPRALVNPFVFEPAIAPHIAAAQSGATIDIAVIARAYTALAGMADVVVVEGAGGFCVPLGADSDGGDLAQRLGLPVILVVGLRLGCLNHALLTAQAIRARGLALVGWVASRIDPAMAAVAENIATLERHLGAPRLADFQYLPGASAEQLVSQFDLTCLDVIQRG